MAGKPYRMSDTIVVIINEDIAAEMVSEVRRSPEKRTVYPLRFGEHDAGFWQVEQLATRRTDAGYDDVTVTLRRVLP